jgi:hypothetical protein
VVNAGRPKRLRPASEVHVCVVNRAAVGILAKHRRCVALQDHQDH